MDVVLGNRYHLTEEIGSGGMAIVYKGHDALLDRTVTVKILREQFSSDEAFIERFRKEAKAVARLSHPNIVSIYDVGQEGGYYYLVMEFVPGWNLKDLIKQRAPLPVGEAVGLMVQLLDGLEHAHNNGIIHRDIKAQNVLVTPAGRVKITDFGLARAATEATVTFQGSIIGSVHYLAPEQAKGEVASPQSDLYAVSVVLYEMLTGKLPFQGETPVSVAMQHLQSEPVPPREYNQSLSPGLEDVVLKGLAKLPQDRFKTAESMRQELEKVAFSTEDPTRVLTPAPNAPKPSLPIQEKPEPVQEETKPDLPVVGTGLASGGDGNLNLGVENHPPRRGGRRLRWWIIPLLVLVAAYGLYLGWGLYWKVSVVSVPQVVGLPLDEAQRKLADMGLQSKVGERISDPSVKEGYVLSQEPAADERVKASRVVTLNVSLGPQMIRVPNVVGMDERAAKMALDDVGLKAAAQSEQVYDAAAPAGRVLRTHPSSGSSVSEGSEVTLVLSKGPEPQPVTVPNIVGLSLDDAKSQLERTGFVLGEVLQAREDSSTAFAGTVMDQDPVAGASALSGSPVKVVVSRGPGPAARIATIEGVNIPDDGKQHRVRILVNDAKGKNQEVYNRMQEPGTVFGTTITYYGRGDFSLYVDGRAYFMNHPL